jgi:hypothetical protein
MKLNVPQKVCLSFFIILVLFWSTLFFLGIKEGFYNYLYSFLFGLTPLVAGLVAMFRSKIWGGLKSSIGKATFFIGLGIFVWGCGELIWSYYNFFLQEPAPYPSWADLGFAPSIFFYGLGAAFLASATGAKFGLRNKIAKAFVILAPFVILAFSYYIIIDVAREGFLVAAGDPVLKTILDIAYPLGDFVALTIAVIISGLSFQYLGGKYKYDIYFILAGLGVMFIGDTVFSYATTVGTYYNANFGDLLLTTGLFFLSFGVLGFYKLNTD